MGIQTNMKTLTPRRQQYKKEIQLISRGFSAPQSWPDGKITVYPWDTDTDEWLMEHARRNNRHRLVVGLLERLCDLNGAPVDQFVASEINTILLVARALNNDSFLRYTSECPACGAKHEEHIRLPDELEKIGEKSPENYSGKVYPGFDDIILPKCKDIVRIRPLLVKDEVKIIDRDADARDRLTDATYRVLLPIVSVGGGAPDTIEEVISWYQALHPSDAKFLREQEEQLTPHLNTRLKHKCDVLECSKEFEHILNLDDNFFR